MNGDGVESARAKLEFAERQLEATRKRYETGTVPTAEYERAQLDRDLAAINLREAQQAPRAGKVPADLREARAKLAELRVNYGENHPEVLAQIKRIEELERITREEPDAPADLREARAMLAELRSKYGENHPLIQQQLARIRVLEGK